MPINPWKPISRRWEKLELETQGDLLLSGCIAFLLSLVAVGALIAVVILKLTTG